MRKGTEIYRDPVNVAQSWIDAADERLDINPDEFECVYFLHAIGTDLVKIGWTRCLPDRMRQLATACPFPLRLIAVATGGKDEERRFHKGFGPYRHNGEWFHVPHMMREFICFTLGCEFHREFSAMQHRISQEVTGGEEILED